MDKTPTSKIESITKESVGYNHETLEAMDEALRVSRDPSIRGYDTIADLKAALESD